MYISLSTLVAFALPFGITAERYIVTCGDSTTPCSPLVLKDLKDAGATVIESFPFGVTVIDSEKDLNPVVSNVAISLDLKVQLEETEAFVATPTHFAPVYQGDTSKDDQGGGRRLQMKSPPFSGDDDFLFDLQWGHTAVRAVEAWNAGVTGAGVRVCVLDEGFDMSHPDLVDNINHELSIAFTDDIPGRPDYLAKGIRSHGSHVAGTIAAANNGYGAIGVAPDAELVLIKVLDELYSGRGSTYGILRGLYYAGLIGCDVINLSLGFVLDRRNIPEGLTQKEFEDAISGLEFALSSGIKYASDNGATIIAASGNSGTNFPENGSDFLRVFADIKSVVPINACGPKGWYLDPANADFNELASLYSDYGRGSEFCGPGGQADFSFPDANATCAFDGILSAPCWVFDMIYSTGAYGQYFWTAGTSMAAPHASGVAALIISEDPCKFKGKPELVKAEMRKRAVDIGKPGRDEEFGFGFVQSGYTAADAMETLPVQLNTAGNYAILAKSGISTVPTSDITGNIGVSPIAATAITGFGLALDSGGQFSTATQVTGKAFAADYGGATATKLTVAVGHMETAYTDAAGRPNADAARINLKGGAIGGLTLTPGVYTFKMGISIATDTEVTFDAGGNINAVFIMQTTGNVLQAANTKVILAGGAQAKNVFWQVAGNFKVGADASMQGILLIKTDVLFMTGSSLKGRILAQTAVNLQMATISDEDEVFCA